MRSLASILIVCLATLGPALAQDARDLPWNVRITAEYIEAPHALVTQVMTSEHADSGPRLHARLREHVRNGRARILETIIITTRTGQRGTAESFAEYPYPARDFPLLTHGFPFPIADPPKPEPEPDPIPADPNSFRLHWPQAWETRNVGILFEVEPFVEPDNKIIDLRMRPEILTLLRRDTWFQYRDDWGDASIWKPAIENRTINVGITVLDGSFAFAGLHTPTKKSGGPDPTRKILLFVRADIIPVGS